MVTSGGLLNPIAFALLASGTRDDVPSRLAVMPTPLNVRGLQCSAASTPAVDLLVADAMLSGHLYNKDLADLPPNLGHLRLDSRRPRRGSLAASGSHLLRNQTVQVLPDRSSSCRLRHGGKRVANRSFGMYEYGQMLPRMRVRETDLETARSKLMGLRHPRGVTEAP